MLLPGYGELQADRIEIPKRGGPTSRGVMLPRHFADSVEILNNDRP